MSLSVRPLSATLQRDTDTFGKSDPYVVLILGQQKKRGKQCNGGGQKPTWNETFNFNAKETVLNIEVWDKDTFSADDLLGNAQYDLKKVYASPNTPFTETINLVIKGKPSGQLIIEFRYTGPPISQQGQQGQQGGNNQQGGWGQQGGQGNQGGWGQQQGQQGGQQGWGQQGGQQGWGGQQQGGQQGWGGQGQQGGQQGWGQQGQPGNQGNQGAWGQQGTQGQQAWGQQGGQGQQGTWGQQGNSNPQGNQGNWGQGGQGNQGGQGGGFVL